jgi:hypothetical protein
LVGWDRLCLRDIQAFYETIPFPKSDTIVMLGSGKVKSGTGIPQSAIIVTNGDELLALLLSLCLI